MTRRETAKLLRDALSLPESERLNLAAALIDSVERKRVVEDVRMAWCSEASRRLDEVRRGLVKPVPWEEAERRIFDTD